MMSIYHSITLVSEEVLDKLSTNKRRVDFILYHTIYTNII